MLTCSSLYSFFLLVVLTLLSATLFPYTTLFRSDRGDRRFDVFRQVRGVDPASAPRQDRAPARAGLQAAHRHALDRKSTRLNSSHLVISYAVFCLKKKKQNKCNILKIPINHSLYY